MRKILSHGTADQMLSAFEQRIALLEDSQGDSVESAACIEGTRRKTNFSRGSADQMLEAFESKIMELEGSDVASSTAVEGASGYETPYGFADVKKYLNGKLEFYGNEIEMDFGDGLKLANYLMKKGEQVNFCPSQETWSIPGECHWGDCYFYPYEANLDGCDDNMIWDGQSYSVDSSTDISASVIKRNGYVEVESNADNADTFVPILVDAVNQELEELDVFDSWTWEQQDSELILTTVTDSDVQEYSIPYADLQMNESDPEEDVQYIMKAITGEGSEQVTSATEVEASVKSVVIPNSAKNEYYQDIGGAFGEADEIYSLEDIMIIWNSECNSDPTLMQYESFADWWRDTRQWVTRVSEKDLTSVENSTDVEASYGEVESDVWEELESKQVQDSDGFYTDYTLYMRTTEESPQYVCVFGDRDVYRPEDGEYDYECDDEAEAYEWFEAYEGIADDEMHS